MAKPAARLTRFPWRAALALALLLAATHTASAKRAAPLPPEALMPPLKSAVFDVIFDSDRASETTKVRYNTT